MLYEIKNDKICVKIDSFGAELKSIIKDGCEYMWQGDPKYWKSSSVTCFPFCGRCYNGEYTFMGETYKVRNHGVARYYEFQVFDKSESHIVFLLKDNENTLKEYPFCFSFFVEYTLDENTLNVQYTCYNTDEKDIYVSFGGHPGFNVPLDKTLKFEDYRVDTNAKSDLEKVIFSEKVFDTGTVETFKLDEKKGFNLNHNLFDNDAIFTKASFTSAKLYSEKDNKSVTVFSEYSNFFGFWHSPKTDAPYLCIEPWQGFCSRDGEVDDIEYRKYMIKILRGDSEDFKYSITVE